MESNILITKRIKGFRKGQNIGHKGLFLTNLQIFYAIPLFKM